MTDESKPVARERPAIAADGGLIPPAARNFDAFVRMCEDGALNAALSDHLQEINAKLNDYAMTYGGVPKASLKLEFKFQLKGGIFEIDTGVKVTLPDEPRGRTIAWSTQDNHFTPSNPKQGALFGVRDA